jgi:hypothetical protein
MYGYLARPSCGSRLNRLLLDLAWLIIQFAIIVAGWVGGALAGYWLSLQVFPSGSANAWIEGGFCVGVGVALAVNHYARGWVRRLRLALLRGWGVAIDAEAGFLDSTRSIAVRGMSHIFYTAGVTWTDPATGVRWQGERRYHFTQSNFRDLSRHAQRFEAAMRYGAPVRVYYPAGKPARFLIDIPFSPAMSDFFLACAAPLSPAKAHRDPEAAVRKRLQGRNRRRIPPHPARRRHR